jgi:Mg2+/citrate symporter
LARGPLVGVIATVLVAWLHGKYGRKLRLKVTDTEIEVEAQTEEQVQSLLKQAQEIQQRNRPKVIRES